MGPVVVAVELTRSRSRDRSICDGVATLRLGRSSEVPAAAEPTPIDGLLAPPTIRYVGLRQSSLEFIPITTLAAARPSLERPSLASATAVSSSSSLLAHAVRVAGGWDIRSRGHLCQACRCARLEVAGGRRRITDLRWMAQPSGAPARTLAPMAQIVSIQAPKSICASFFISHLLLERPFRVG